MTSPSPKHWLPVLRNPTIDRPTLVAQLALALEHKLTLVAAPPGYSKTTIVAQFAHQTTVPVVWHTVEERERDLPNLMAHCLQAISIVLPDIARLESHSSTTAAQMATVLTDYLRSALLGDLVYVLDDIQNIMGSPDAERWLQVFIEGMPPQIHVILIGRALPTLPIIEMIARREVLALGQEQLRFTFQEIHDLAQYLGVPISALEIQNIVARFDGWVAGSVLALQPLPNNIASAVFGERYAPEALFDALAEVMLRAQDKALQEFLLASSTLSRMTPTLCQLALQLPQSREFLSEALSRNVFVAQISAGLTYHPLFREFLQRRLKTHDPMRFVELHCLAAQWFEENDRLEEAFDHYVSAGYLQEAGSIAERVAGAYLSQGKSETVLYWRGQLAEASDHFPQLLFICATIRVSRYQYDVAEEELAKAGQGFQRRDERVGVLKAKLSQANIDNLRGQPQQAVDLTEDVLRRFDIPRNLRGYAHSILGRAYQSLGSISVALQHLEAALPLYRETGDKFAIGNLLLALEIAYMRVGRFEESSAFLQEALEMLRAVGSAVDLLAPLNNLGYSYHLLGDYEQAFRVFQEGLQIAVPLSEKRGESYLYNCMADLQRDRGDYGEAISLYRKALHTVGSYEPTLRCIILVNFATLRRWQGNLEEGWVLANEAAHLAEKHGLPFEKITAQVCLAAMRAQQGEPKEAQNELIALAEALRKQVAPTQWAHAVVLRAFAALLSGDTFSAHEHLKSATESVVHETNLHPGVAEIVHTPLLKSFFQLHRSRYPTLLKAITRLEAAQVENPARETISRKSTSILTYSLRLWALGQERTERDGVTVAISDWRAIDARELFFYLLLKGATTREQLGLVLWEDSTSEQVRGKFHATLHRARNAVGTNTIRFEDDLYFIDPDVDVWCDAIEFGALVQKARLSSSLRPYTEDVWSRAVALYEGELLPSFGAAWIVPHREALHRMYVEALLSLGTCIRARGSFREALATFQLALEVDPYREDVYRAIIMCYAALGEHSSIQQEMDSLTRFLDTELGITPSVETLTLAQSLLN